MRFKPAHISHDLRASRGGVGARTASLRSNNRNTNANLPQAGD